jgi:chaperonin cofactor prefoldin
MVESYFTRLKQVEDRISMLKDKIDIKERSKEYIDRRLKSNKRNLQELCDSI